MSKIAYKGDRLHPLQGRIVLNLAKNSPQTINKTAKKIKSHYKPSWIAFKSLERKGLISKVNTMNYCGIQYPQFWLTDEGVVVAMLEGASPEILLKKVSEVYPKNEILRYCLEIGPKLNPEVFRIGLAAVRSKGKLEPIDVTTILLAQMQKNISIEDFKEIMNVLRKYPKEYSSLKVQFGKMSKDLDQLKELIET